MSSSGCQERSQLNALENNYKNYKNNMPAHHHRWVKGEGVCSGFKDARTCTAPSGFVVMAELVFVSSLLLRLQVLVFNQVFLALLSQYNVTVINEDWEQEIPSTFFFFFSFLVLISTENLTLCCQLFGNK